MPVPGFPWISSNPVLLDTMPMALAPTHILGIELEKMRMVSAGKITKLSPNKVPKI
jgi:hypothetical protein